MTISTASSVSPLPSSPQVRPSAFGSSKVAALAWEFWRLVRLRVLAAWVGIGCIDALYYQMATLISDELPPEVQTNLFLAVFFTNVTLIVVLLVRTRQVDERHDGEFGPRVFLLPLPTWQLVLWRMALPAATAAGLWLAVSALTLAVSPRGATGDDWPLLDPALVAATLTAIGLALAWLPLRPKALKTLVTWGVLTGPVVWTISRFGRPGEGPPSLTGSELLALAGVLSAAYALAVYGTSLARRGSTLGLPDLRTLADGLGRRHRKPVRGRFRSPITAQLWFEWRHKGWVVPFFVACGMTLVAILVGTLRGAPQGPFTLLAALVKVGIFFLVAAPVMLGCVIGRSSQSRGEAALDVFRASRPISDTSHAYTLLATGALSLLATWGTMVATGLAALGVADLASRWSPLGAARQMIEGVVQSLGWNHGPLAVATLLVVSWTNMALVTTVFLTGRNRVVAALVVGPYALAIGAFLAFATMDFAAISDLVVAGSWVVSALALIGTAVAFVIARGRRLIEPWIPWASFASMLGLGLVFVLPRLEQILGFYDTGVALERATMVLIPGVLALAAAPLALAPLALAWNRHR